MLLRICLILSIVAGLAVISLTQFVVRPQMQETLQSRNDFSNQWFTTDRTLTKTKKDLRETQDTLQKTQTELDDTKTALVAANNKAAEQQRRGDTLQRTLNETRGELTAAQQKLSAWDALGIPVDQVKEKIENEKNLRAANEALEAEKQVLIKVNGKLNDELDLLRNPERIPPMRADMVGRVVAVDAKWDFVVLDVGENQGVKVRGVMMVSRDSKLVGKVQITTTQPDSSIANVMAGWKLDELQEGDVVVPYVVQ